MASTATSRAKKTAARGKPLISATRKLEILGLIMIALGVLVSLAIISYRPTDDGIARTFSIEIAFSLTENRAGNLLGMVGAVIARMMVPGFFGYPSLVLPGLLMFFGYVTLRHRKTDHGLLVSLLALLAMATAASIFGWIGAVSGTALPSWSGAWGATLSNWLANNFGVIGAAILLVLSTAVLALLLVDRDIQRTIDRLETAVLSVRERWAAFNEEREAARAERQAQEDILEEKRERERETEKAFAKPVPPPPKVPQTLAVSTSPSQRPSATTTLNDSFSRPQPVVPATEQQPTITLPVRPPAPFPQTGAPPFGKQGSLELQVQERIEEERAESIVRETDVPNEEMPYSFPSIDLLESPVEGEYAVDYGELEENKLILLDKLQTYNIELTAINAIVGPTVTLYELTPAPGIKISRITALEDDLAMAMAARGIRMIAPIPGKTAVGVEIPNRHRELVRVRDVLGTARFRDTKMELPVPIGKTIEGEVFIEDLTKMPHLLVAGATGSGKSVGINTLITGLMYACHPANLKFVIIDPKKIELQQYARVSDHFVAMPPFSSDPIITDFQQALGVLKSCEKEMERRYDLLSKATVRGIKDYNKKFQQGLLKPEEGHRHLPYLVVVVDELADLMMTAGKEIEGPIARLAQMARAVGIHLVLATQRPSVDVITGLIKANFPARIAYQVASKVDSRTILDQNGAEGLVGNGDLLYMSGSRLIRLQGPFISVDEVDHVVNFIADQRGSGPYILPDIEVPVQAGGDASFGSSDDSDDLFDEAARIIVRSQQGSVSLLQRKLSVGYTRAARIVDQLEEAGIVGPFEGSKARQVLVESEVLLEEMLRRRDEE
jgi:DNA segregation ATPase FtsK/SpoIIIE, S-DNA-T family